MSLTRQNPFPVYTHSCLNSLLYSHFFLKLKKYSNSISKAVTLSLGLSCWIIVSSGVMAQDASVPDNSEVEEVIVIADMDEYELTELVTNLEHEVYDMYNALNEDNSYDILCTSRPTTGSMLSETRCRPRFLDELQLTYGGGEEAVKRGDVIIPEGVIAQHQKVLQEKMVEVMEENPDVLKAFANYQAHLHRLQELTAD